VTNRGTAGLLVDRGRLGDEKGRLINISIMKQQEGKRGKEQIVVGAGVKFDGKRNTPRGGRQTLINARSKKEVYLKKMKSHLPFVASAGEKRNNRFEVLI